MSGEVNDVEDDIIEMEEEEEAVSLTRQEAAEAGYQQNEEAVEMKEDRDERTVERIVIRFEDADEDRSGRA